MSRTYVENNVLEQLPQDYTEEALQKKFAGTMESLREELEEYNSFKAELDEINATTDWQDPDADKIYSQQELQAEYLSLYRDQKPLQRKYNEARINAELLEEYGTTFAQLYRIKDNNEKFGNAEEMSFVEVDITDNGDMLTQDQYFKMRADPEGRVRQLALHVEDEEEDLEFNVGMMEYNQPNTPPQTKMQLSFDDENIDKLEEGKLKAIFNFCESHGLSTMDMEIRRFDGTLAEDEIQERIKKGLEKIKKEKEAEIAEENAKEAAQQLERRKELEAELVNMQTARGGDLPVEEMLADISYDLPFEDTIIAAAPNDKKPTLQMLPNGNVVEIPAENTLAEGVRAQKNIHKIADGVATAAIPEDKVPDGIEVVPIEQTKTVAEHLSTNAAENRPQTVTAEVSEPTTAPTKSASAENPKAAEQKSGAELAVVQNAEQTEATKTPTDKPAEEIAGQAPASAEAAEKVTEAESVSLSVPAPQNGTMQTQAQTQTQPQPQPQAQTPQASAPQGQPQPATASQNTKQKEVEKKFEKFLEEGLAKKKDSSYFKQHTGWFGSGWTEYVVYDNEDPDNQKKDGVKTKDGSVKYTYSFKLFIKVDKDGNVNFAYRTPNRRKMDETAIGGIIGQLKDMGYKYISFPPGRPKDEEKGMWRKLMAENGIVPIGMGLNKSKAEGMLKAAKEKLSTEAYNDFQYRLAKQMKENNDQKGKPVDESEQIFIDGLFNTHKYAAFTDAYSLVYKSKIKKILRSDNPQEGAIDKVAAYRTLLQVFEVYKSALENGGNILSSNKLTPEEKRLVGQFANGSAEKLNAQQMNALYDVLYIRQRKEADKLLCDQLFKQVFNDVSKRGAKATFQNVLNKELNTARGRCDSINDDLTALGIEKIEIIKISDVRLDFERFINVDLPDYERAHPKQQNSAPARNNSGNSGNANEGGRNTAKAGVKNASPEKKQKSKPEEEQENAAPQQPAEDANAKEAAQPAREVSPDVARSFVANQRSKGM